MKAGRLVAAAGVLLLSCPGVAQETSSCGWELGKWVCRSQNPLQGPGSNFHNNMMQEFERAQAQRKAADQSRQAGEMRQVWIRCRKKWNEAIEARDFELANALAQGCPAAP